MFEVVLNKIFKDPENNKDVYVLSIQMGSKYYNLNVTKEEFLHLTSSMVSIRDNQLLND
jgi:hypothetical protein